MGILKDYASRSPSFLDELGFITGRDPCGGREGYTKTVHHSGNETLWITVSLRDNKVYLYNEWDCGGMLWNKTLDIPEEALANKNTFVDWLEEKV